MAIFFSQRKPRDFGYRPRYYDPAKEEREARKRIVLGEKYKPAGAAEYVPGAILREHVAARRGAANAAENMRKRRRKTAAPIVLVGVLVLAGLLFYIMYLK